eukprot:gene4753-21450_t
MVEAKGMGVVQAISRAQTSAERPVVPVKMHSVTVTG